jgi:hypothetical protein
MCRRKITLRAGVALTFMGLCGLDSGSSTAKYFNINTINNLAGREISLGREEVWVITIQMQRANGRPGSRALWRLGAACFH